MDGQDENPETGIHSFRAIALISSTQGRKYTGPTNVSSAPFCHGYGYRHGITRNTAELVARLFARKSSTTTLKAQGPGFDPSMSRVR